jgi:hypothetical protein
MSFFSRKICISPKVSSIPAWNNSTFSKSSNWQSIAYGSAGFVVVSNTTGETVIPRSPDGASWTNATQSLPNGFKSIAYGNGIYVAMYGTGCLVSSNGINWSYGGTLDPTGLWNTIAFGGGVFIATSITNKSAYSTDGINWTEVFFGGIIQTCSFFTAYGNGRFISISGETASKNFGTYSDNNGVSWTNFTLPLTQTWQSIAYGNGVFVIIASGSGTALYSNNNGSSWTSFTMPGGTGTWNSVAYGNGMFIAIAGSSTRAAYSYNGINWTASTLPGASAGWEAITYGNNRFVAISSASNRAIYTT